jgi:hypothetical protein
LTHRLDPTPHVPLPLSKTSPVKLALIALPRSRVVGHHGAVAAPPQEGGERTLVARRLYHQPTWLSTPHSSWVPILAGGAPLVLSARAFSLEHAHRRRRPPSPPPPFSIRPPNERANLPTGRQLV